MYAYFVCFSILYSLLCYVFFSFFSLWGAKIVDSKWYSSLYLLLPVLPVPPCFKLQICKIVVYKYLSCCFGAFFSMFCFTNCRLSFFVFFLFLFSISFTFYNVFQPFSCLFLLDGIGKDSVPYVYAYMKIYIWILICVRRHNDKKRPFVHLSCWFAQFTMNIL